LDSDSFDSPVSMLLSITKKIAHKAAQKVEKETGILKAGKRIIHIGRYSSAPATLAKATTWSPLVLATFFGIYPIILEIQRSRWNTRGSLLSNIDEPTEEGITPLMIASFRGDEATTEALLACGANVNKTTPTGNSCLHVACIFSSSVATMLLQHGAAVNAQTTNGYTPLHVTAMGGGESGDILKLLVRYGADLHATTDSGINALHIASEICNLQFLEPFLEELFKEQTKQQREGKSLRVSKYKVSGEPSSISSSVNALSVVNAQDNFGQTALHTVCYHNRGKYPYVSKEAQRQTVRKLFEYGADPFVTDATKRTPFEVAVLGKGHPEILDILEELITNRQYPEA
jgi:ankyrin repeat protein